MSDLSGAPPPPPPPPPQQPWPPPGSSAGGGYAPAAPQQQPAAYAASPAPASRLVGAGAGAAAGAAGYAASKVFSLLLAPLLIVAGAFAVLRTCGVIAGTGFHFGIRSTFHVPSGGSHLLIAILGAAAFIFGLIMMFTAVRLLRFLPLVRTLLVLLQAGLLAAVIVALFASHLL